MAELKRFAALPVAAGPETTLKDKVQVLQFQLGIEPGPPLAQIVASAVEACGLSEALTGLPLNKQADACLAEP